MKTNLEIAQQAKLKQIKDIGANLGLNEHDITLYGRYKAKLSLDLLEKLSPRPNVKTIVISAVTPTPFGEGKTLTAIGLTQALGKMGKRVIVTLREPSLGPLFGIKGGACGGGMSQVLPMEDINLHFTGDAHAVEAAHNLLAAMLDNTIHHKNPLHIDVRRICWPRCIDSNDRVLRSTIIGLGGTGNGFPRESHWIITAASEVMSILALAGNLADLRDRLGRIIVAYTFDRKKITSKVLNCAGAMTALLKDAIKPNLVQTLEGQPCLIHTGPFANIAHGNSSVLADQLAIRLADYVVTESGFGADCGAEKMMNIKCRASNIIPDCVVLTTTVRAMKMHGKMNVSLDAVSKGCENMVKHINNIRKFGLRVVVAVNCFTTDTEEEINIIRNIAIENGAADAVAHTCYADGGNGGLELARAVTRVCNQSKEFRFLYSLDSPIEEKINCIAREIYGADGVSFETNAQRKLRQLQKDDELANLAVCMAKTQFSLSHNPKLLNVPKNFCIPVRDIIPYAGAGFLTVMCGNILTLPGLPLRPAACDIDITPDGQITGLF